MQSVSKSIIVEYSVENIHPVRTDVPGGPDKGSIDSGMGSLRYNELKALRKQMSFSSCWSF